MENITTTWPLLVAIIIFLILGYLWTVMSEKRLLRALSGRNNPKTKQVWRPRIFEVMWVLQKIDERKADDAINAIISRYGMGKVKWGHLHWAYEQVQSSRSLDKSSMPNEEGI